MWMLLRKTARRGRDSVPSRRRRIRSWRLRRAAPRLATCVIFVTSFALGSPSLTSHGCVAASAPHSRTCGCARFGCSAPPCQDSPSRRLPALFLAADLAGLAGLAADPLAGVLDALALVRLRLASGADLRGDLTDELLVDPDDRQAGRALELERDPGRGLDVDLVAVAQVELELLADLRRAVAHARDLETLAVAVGDADDHVVHKGPRQ